MSEVEFTSPSETAEAAREQPAIDRLAALQLLWDHRQLFLRTAIWAVVISTAIAFLIPRCYEPTASIMPPDSLNGNSGAMMAMLAEKGFPRAGCNGWEPAWREEHRSTVRTPITKSDRAGTSSRKIPPPECLWDRYKQDARKILNKQTEIAEDRKSGVIAFIVRDWLDCATGARYRAGLRRGIEQPGRASQHLVRAPAAHFH